MAGVLVVMAVLFHIFTGNFLTPENLYNIAQQTAVVGIVAAAVALIIVARQIDLSVGSVMGVVGVLIAFLMYSKNWNWVPASFAGLALAAGDRWLYQGWLTVVPRRAFVRRHAGRPDVVPRRGLSGGRRQDAAGERPGVPGAGRRARRLARAGVELGARRRPRRTDRCGQPHRAAAQCTGARFDPMRPLWFDATLAVFFIVVLLGFVADDERLRAGRQGAPARAFRCRC